MVSVRLWLLQTKWSRYLWNHTALTWSSSSVLATLSICLLFCSAWLLSLADWGVCSGAVGGAKLVENLECTWAAHAWTTSDIHSIIINIWKPAVQSLIALFLLLHTIHSCFIDRSLREVGAPTDSFKCKAKFSESFISHAYEKPFKPKKRRTDIPEVVVNTLKHCSALCIT